MGSFFISVREDLNRRKSEKTQIAERRGNKTWQKKQKQQLKQLQHKKQSQQLKKESGLGSAEFYTALGWLARESKINVEVEVKGSKSCEYYSLNA